MVSENRLVRMLFSSSNIKRLFFHKIVRNSSTGTAHAIEATPSTSRASDPTAKLKKIGLVPPRLHSYLFGAGEVPENAIEDPFPTLELPELRGKSLVEHFQSIGKSQMAECRKRLDQASKLSNFPPMPEEWNFEVGWTKYDPDTGALVAVECPEEELLFFDVEVCVSEGQLPTLAVALSPSAWYSWCSERLVRNTDVPDLYRLKHLIPLESSHGENAVKVVIGHNVAYDRSRVREQYLRKESNVKFWDTMSMAIPIYGMADHQVPVYEKNDEDQQEAWHNGWEDEWRTRVSRNALAALHEKLCRGTSKLTINKSMQSFFVKESMEEIRKAFQCLVRYCAEDVLACLEVYQAIFPEFVKRFSHPTTWMGMVEMGSVYLPITNNWRTFYENCEKKASAENGTAAQGLMKAAKTLADELSNEEKFKNDPWMWHEDWSKDKYGTPAWYLNLLRQKKLAEVPVAQLQPDDVKAKARVVPFLFGLCYGPYPIHYKADKGLGFLVPKGHSVSEKNTAGEPLFDACKVTLRRGDDVMVPFKIVEYFREIMDLIEENIANGVGDVSVEKPVADLGPFTFHRLPHPLGPGLNVGDVMVNNFQIDVSEGILRPTRFKDEFMALFNAKKATRFWGNYRDRFKEQLPVWLDEEYREGSLAPSVIPAGTVTRRAVHKLWLTAINSKDDELIGTELKSMIECPEGWYLVGADVDSQEQWIAAMLGDSAIGRGIAGATLFSNMLLAGSKADRSDLHSVVAKEVNISRDKAKVLNYARLYGAGVMHAIEFLKQSGISELQAQRISEKLFETTKGRRSGYLLVAEDIVKYFLYFLKSCPEKLKNEYIYLNGRYFVPDVRCSKKSGLTRRFEGWFLKKIGNTVSGKGIQYIDRSIYATRLYENDRDPIYLYSGGFESATFNYLELVVRQEHPKTPVLGCQLGYALEPLPKTVPDREYFCSKYKRSIVNWVVQSSAVDFLHLLLSCMKWLCAEYEINARFVISIHDEVRYMVPEEDRYRCALALMLSNMLVRAMISQKLGVNQLPLSVAFFSQVDIDRVLRKEVNLKCRTPEGKEIPPGEALDMKAVLEKTGGSLKKNSKLCN